MNVEVKLYGSLRRFRPKISSAVRKGNMPHHPFGFELSEGATVLSLVSRLGIPEGMLTAAAVNGEAVDVTSRLREGDEVGLFPPTAGG